MLNDKLDNLMVALKLSSVDIAEAAGFDRSNVSRLRTGARKIPRDSSAAKKLVDGIIIFSNEHNLNSGLCSLLKLEPDSDKNSIKIALKDYLFPEECPELHSARHAQERGCASSNSQTVRKGYSNFAYKLDLIMNITCLMNVTLSRMLHVDASLISRYRNGSVTPRSNPELSQKLAAMLWDIITKSGKLNELASLMHLSPDLLDERHFYGWLCDYESVSDTETAVIGKFLGAFDSFSAETGIILPSFEESVSEEILKNKTSEYFGYEGLREAVLRFLGSAVMGNKKGDTLFLYSDQKMDWMVADTGFRNKWASLMSMLVKKGIMIKIIHNIDRDLSEMSTAILSWLPLYMSGMIESYYCLKAAGERFSHTLFVNPSHCCIDSVHVIGTEENGFYNYHTNPDTVKHFENSYLKFMENTRPLVYFAQSGLDNKSDLVSSSGVCKEFPSIPFKNIKIRAQHEYVRISHNLIPEADIIFTHPLMCQAFCSYLAGQ